MEIVHQLTCNKIALKIFKHRIILTLLQKKRLLLPPWLKQVEQNVLFQQIQFQEVSGLLIQAPQGTDHMNSAQVLKF